MQDIDVCIRIYFHTYEAPLNHRPLLLLSLSLSRRSFRCLSCNQTLPHMHGSPAKTVPHKALSPVSSTFADSRRPYLVENGVVLAQYPHGRQGALRPMGLAGKPGVPRDLQSREGSREGSRGKLGAGFSISQRSMRATNGSWRGGWGGSVQRPGTGPGLAR